MSVIRVAALAVALCAGMTSIAGAQDTSQRGQAGARRNGGFILKDIQLNAAQTAQVKVIREKYVPRMMELRKATEHTGVAPDEQTRAKMMELQNAQTAEIRAILTPDQQKVLDRNIAEMKARLEQRRNGGGR